MEIYFDNQPHEINKDPKAKNWRETKIAKIPKGTRVLGIKATNRGVNPGLIASVTGNRLFTDHTWKFTTSTPSKDWAAVSYDAKTWKNARVLARHGREPRNVKIEHISDSAYWIWSDDEPVVNKETAVFFRTELGWYRCLVCRSNHEKPKNDASC